MQKSKVGSTVKDILVDFGMACTKIEPGDVSVKDLPKRDWPDEDGDDVYIPSVLPLDAYDLLIGVSYKGKQGTSLDKADELLDYLTGRDGSGSGLKLYVPYDGIGRSCRLSKIGKPSVTKMGDDEVLELELTMRVDNPRSRVAMSLGVDGELDGLTETAV